MPAYFSVTGTPNGGRNDISLKNEFIVVVDAVPVEQPKIEQPKPEPQPPTEPEKPDEPKETQP